MSKVLLIDGDVIAFRAALLEEKEVKWEDDIITLHTDFAKMTERFDRSVAELLDDLAADNAIVALTDREHNFRKDIYPLYKSKRGRKPLGYSFLIEHVKSNHRWRIMPGLEGDDVIGIWATNPKLRGDKIIVSIDKDMKTIPGSYYDMGKPEQGVLEISPEEADAFHMVQSLAGDTVDGYPGCNRMGMLKSAQVVEDPHRLVRVEKEITRGKNKGDIRVTWEQGDPCSVWQAIVDHYDRAGLSEEFALTQARCARILRHGEVDKDGKPILWEPPKVQ